MLNTVTLAGRMTKDPEIRRTQSGKAVVSFSIACERDFKNNGEKVADFFNIVAWGNTAEFVGKYIGKGRMVAVAGRLETRSYENRNGDKVHVTEVNASSVYPMDRAQKSEAPAYNEAPMTEIDDDGVDLPF